VNWRSLCVKNSQKQAVGLLANLGDRARGPDSTLLPTWNHELHGAIDRFEAN
jgi:hypothetical protein